MGWSQYTFMGLPCQSDHGYGSRYEGDFFPLFVLICRKLAHTVSNERKAAWELLSAKRNSSTPLRNEQAAWEALLDEIGEAHMTQPEVAGG
jgi:hypothetical protein